MYSADAMYLWPGSAAYVPQRPFWIIALLRLYSAVSMFSPLAASFSNTVNTMEGNKE